MNIGYLNTLDSSIFEIICRCDSNKKIELELVLLTPMIRFIDNEDYTRMVIENIENYIKELNSINISLKESEEFALNEDYFLLGVNSLEDNKFGFRYSESFNIEQSDLENLKNRGFKLADILLSTMEFDSDNIKNNIEKELSQILRLNYNPIEDGVTDILGVCLDKDELDNCNLSLISYNGKIEKDVADKFFNLSMYLIESNIKNFNLFLIDNPTIIIKLGISTTGEYKLDLNESLLFDFSEEEKNELKENLISVFDTI